MRNIFRGPFQGLSGASGDESTQLQFISRLLPVLTGVIGVAGTLAWWRYADQT
ncbi:hypothetical protein [Paenibacillus graminis]|uniref:hypothetical protein n=1 Tax=Paenibacillus graminis TaxID=189425 RepID=UPI002DB676FB|nr:hypothetical protein [Paenibacillus graminis]MEC0168241.1 hypothetical protein [Paenibacillus graminis]